jgi:hypothetical protein
VPIIAVCITILLFVGFWYAVGGLKICPECKECTQREIWGIREDQCTEIVQLCPNGVEAPPGGAVAAYLVPINRCTVITHRYGDNGLFWAEFSQRAGCNPWKIDEEDHAR